MSGTVFPQKEAGDFFNHHFVCVEFDMEKGEGIEIQKKYGVRAFPTFLILEPSGVERYRVVGSGALSEFIPRIKRGLNPKNACSVLEKEYASGKMKKERKLTYLIALQDAYSKQAVTVREELLAELSPAEKLLAPFWPLIDDSFNAPTIETLTFVAKNQAKLKKNVGEQQVVDFQQRGYASLLNKYINESKRTEAGAQLIATINDHVAQKYIVPGAALEAKLKIAQAISNDDSVGVVTLIEENAPVLDISDLFNYMVSFGRFDVKDKALMVKVVKAGEAIAACSPEGEIKTMVEKYFERYKKAASVGVYWENLTLDEALAAAKNEKKLVFMDCYTTWCGPCKYMANTIFTRPEVGDFFNEHFINVKYDMEEGNGPEIAKRYSVQVYPMFILLHPDGTVQHKIAGSSEDIVAEIQQGLSDEHSTGSLDKKYAGGNRDKEFLTAYLKQLIDLGEIEKATEVCNILNATLSEAEKISKDYWFVYESDSFSGDGSENFRYLLDHKKAFVASVGKALVDEKIFNVYFMRLYPFLLGQEKGDPAYFTKMKKELAAYKLTGEKELFASIELVKGYVEGDANKLLKTCEKEFSHLTEERIDIAIFTLNYLKKNTTGQLPRLKALAEAMKEKVQFEDYKMLLTTMFEEKSEEEE
jgi:thiol-disulfide isomerase/thioredoxin